MNKDRLCWLSSLAQAGHVPTTKADECRAHAAQCEQRAEHARKHGWDTLAEEYMRIAQQWRTMAEQSERFDLF
jgi:hypothetical protein